MSKTPHRDIHLHGHDAGALEHAAFATPDLQNLAGWNSLNAFQYGRPVHSVEVADDAGDLRIVALAFSHILVQLTF
jgi:hypothetical protein